MGLVGFVRGRRRLNDRHHRAAAGVSRRLRVVGRSRQQCYRRPGVDHGTAADRHGVDVVERSGRPADDDGNAAVISGVAGGEGCRIRR